MLLIEMLKLFATWSLIKQQQKTKQNRKLTKKRAINIEDFSYQDYTYHQ